jgi:hypothetical protein
MTEDEMKAESVRILTRFYEQKVDRGDGMVILAMTLATTFKTNKVSAFEAINRFATIVKHVYGETK